jgi:hypothetical protein
MKNVPYSRRRKNPRGRARKEKPAAPRVKWSEMPRAGEKLKRPRKKPGQAPLDFGEAVLIPNPTTGGLRPAHLVMDRALRYRAAAELARQGVEKRCIYCGRPSGPLMAEHIDGYEENPDPSNLAYACRSCNTAKGAAFQRAGLGRRTRTYNPYGPHTKKGAQSLNQWTWAAMAVTGKLDVGPEQLHEAASLIKHTPQSRRSEFAREIWSRRRKRRTGGTGRRKERPKRRRYTKAELAEVPF